LMLLGSSMDAFISEILDSSVRSPQWVTTSADADERRGVGCQSASAWVSERMRGVC
jgi:hypothetical protein